MNKTYFQQMTHGSLFSGIGGFDLAAQWHGWINVFQCENDPFCQRVLKYYFPNTDLHEDIRTTDFTKYKGTIDIVSGGFPCQPFSNAGKRKGASDDRHLWPEMLRAIREIQPAWVVVENVSGLLTIDKSMVFERICTDMEAEEYEVRAFVVPACAVGAPHRRERVWIIANRTDAGIEGMQSEREDGIYASETVADADSIRSNQSADSCRRQKQIKSSAKPQRKFTGLRDKWPSSDATGSRRLQDNKSKQTEQSKQNIPDWRDFPTQSPVCNRNDGFPGRLDGITFPAWRNGSIHALGNAVVPQAVYEIFKIIEKIKIRKQFKRQ